MAVSPPQGATAVALAVALVTVFGPAAASAAPERAVDEGVEVAARPAPREALPMVAVSGDVGVPDGLMASLVLRPSSIVRLALGAGFNSSSPGFRGGVTLLPFGAGPSLTLEAGHYLPGEAGGVVRTAVGGIGRFASYVGRLDYSFVNAHAGVDFGSEWFTFFVHGGVSYLRAGLHDIAVPPEATAAAGQPQTTITFREDPVLRMFTPSVKFGLVFYLQ